MTEKELIRFIGTEIKIARIRAGMKQSEVCDIAGVQGACYSAIELGKRGARIDTYMRIAKALGVEIKSFFP